MRRRTFLAGALAPAAGSTLAQADSGYPARMIKLVVPYPPGSGPDMLGRLVAQQLQSALRQAVVVENRAGALGMVGTSEVARAAGDGYTLLLTTNTTQAANVALVRNLPYDPVKDFVPVTRIAAGPMMLLVREDSPYGNISELVRLGRGEKPLPAGYGSTASQVAAAKLSNAGKLNVVNVPYKGIPPAVTDLLGGHLAFTFADLPVAIPLVQSGRVRGLGVTSVERLADHPAIPSLSEFFPGLEVIGWQGVVAPANTPAQVVARLDETLRQALREKPEFAQRLRDMHQTVAPLSTAKFGDFILQEIARWKEDAKQAGIQPE